MAKRKKATRKNSIIVLNNLRNRLLSVLEDVKELICKADTINWENVSAVDDSIEQIHDITSRLSGELFVNRC